MSEENLPEEKKEEISTSEEYLGPNYPYHTMISTPEEMGMSPKGDLDTLGTNITGLINYGSLLMMGDTIANKKIKYEQANLGGQQPVGDRIFVKTQGKCLPKNRAGQYIEVDDAGKPKGWPDDFKLLTEQEKEPKELPPRYVFIDHIPTGNIPGIGNLSSMKGFVPGLMDNIFKLNPIKIIDAMKQPANPDCLYVDFQTIKYDKTKDISNQHVVANEGQWVSIEDLKDLNPCSFKRVNCKGCKKGFPKIDGKPVDQNTIDGKFQHPMGNPDGPMKDGASCNWMPSEESFTNLFKMKNKTVKNPIINVKNKPIAKIYNAGFGILLAYLLYRILRKEL